MDNVVERDYLSVLDAKTCDELHVAVERFTQRLGFQTFSAVAVVDSVLGEADFVGVSNTPKGYQDTFHDAGLAKRDPVMQHCKTRGVPIVWNQATYAQAGLIDKWEHQARYGYRCGIMLAMHLPAGRHFVIGVDRDQDLPTNAAEVTHMTASLQLFVAYAHEAAMPILAPSPGVANDPGLTPRELESLRWTLEGKTAWEVGRILGIAENTVIRHTHHAAQKLGCTSKHHAAVKALRMGLIC